MEQSVANVAQSFHTASSSSRAPQPIADRRDRGTKRALQLDLGPSKSEKDAFKRETYKAIDASLNRSEAALQSVMKACVTAARSCQEEVRVLQDVRDSVYDKMDL
jgi:hypothetical protein